MTAPADTLMGRLLLRAADGDEQAAEDFWALRAMFAEAQERSRNLARKQAWKMISRPNHFTRPDPNGTP